MTRTIETKIGYAVQNEAGKYLSRSSYYENDRLDSFVLLNSTPEGAFGISEKSDTIVAVEYGEYYAEVETDEEIPA